MLEGGVVGSCRCLISLVTVVGHSRPAARELFQRGHDVPGRQSVRVEQRQHSETLGDLRHHGGRIFEENRLRSPVTSSMRRPFSRGALTSMEPAAVVTDRLRW